MPDITKCTNSKCPIRAKCERWTSKPSKYEQAYQKFEPIPCENDNGLEWFCRHFKDNKKQNSAPKKRGRKKGVTYTFTMESWMMANAKPGSIFYSKKESKDLTAIASHHSRKITTERLNAVSTGKLTPTVESIVKVTIL